MLMLLHVQGQVQPLWGVWSCRGALKRHHYGILPTAPLGAAQKALNHFEGKDFKGSHEAFKDFEGFREASRDSKGFHEALKDFEGSHEASRDPKGFHEAFKEGGLKGFVYEQSEG